MILAGYWLAARFSGASAGERLAVATLAGLGVLLWSVSVVNLFRPLAGWPAWLCLWPIALTLASRSACIGLVRDFNAVALNRRGTLMMLFAATFVGFLLWPLLSRPALVFYDGTGNHDAFFWITGADHLQRHTYLEAPTVNATHPVATNVSTIVGWRPAWGRMGGEGLLALLATLFGLTPLELYLAVTAALFVPWAAAVYLVARTFFVEQLTWPAMFALVALQPMFVFFHGNANLPNLLGALAGAMIVVATERSLRGDAARGGWLAVLALGLHALLCCYPEMLPFVAVPAGLLWVRASAAARRPAWDIVWAVVAGLVLNVASTIRAWHGFVSSLHSAQTQQGWANIFRPLSLLDRGPAMVMLSPRFGYALGLAGGALCSLLLIGTAVLAIMRARDRFGAIATLTGAGVLLVYTFVTGFDYGWQKTAQVGAIFLTALFTAGVSEPLMPGRGLQILRGPLLATIFALFGYATFLNCLESYKWSEQKFISRDWFTLRDYARDKLLDAPVLIDGGTFEYPFFHTMWATYFLADSAVYFTGNQPTSGGHLRPFVIDETPGEAPAPHAIVVSSAWAARAEPDAPRLMSGDFVTLLKTYRRSPHP